MRHVIIIGNGIAGTTAAQHLRKLSHDRITVVSDESDYFFSRTALMYVYMGHMKFEHTQPYENKYWSKNNIELKKGRVHHVDASNKELLFTDNTRLSFDVLIIASGSKPNKFGWPGQDLKGVRGLYHKQDLEALEKATSSIKHAVVVGGGLIGIELAEMLLSRGKTVSFLVRESSFWNNILPKKESKMINHHIVDHGIDLRLSTNLVEIQGNSKDEVKSVITDKGDVIPCQWVGLTAGVSPNVDFLLESKIDLGKGVLVNQYLETSCKDIYAIGDCAEQTQPIGLRRPIEAVWYTGRMMGESVAQTIVGNKTVYNPGNWFNSAKFFDIEYQTYGWVFAQPRDYEKQLYWQNGNTAIRLAFHKESGEFLGINTFGIRMRHETFDRWLSEKVAVQYVIAHLKEAHFDPEFFRVAIRKIQQSLEAQIQLV